MSINRVYVPPTAVPRPPARCPAPVPLLGAAAHHIVCRSRRSLRHVPTTVRHAPRRHHSPVSAPPRTPAVLHATRPTPQYTHPQSGMHATRYAHPVHSRASSGVQATPLPASHRLAHPARPAP
ncbi:hypothetical protein HYPSUDRAFT_199634 [Hypholoma sublateritium FD-334 SS-4]|uniref:Uncharacterized protein n=1 Tax=Hypholoma sublateritium (strain FD-334 SS-4) TaxID=945553 RepID=A0A0D2Q1P5_HYPSF|nr:hypothetical protein HYPSUDRAFT_199634 [Hypholoma sublateritium FD-334 SS-4]